MAKKHRFDTIAVKGGFGWDEQLRYRTMAPPLIQSAVFPYESAEWAADLYSYKIEGFAYGRINNPTNDIFEKRMAMLEGGEAGLATSSGMSAIFMVLHHLVEAGQEIVSSIRVYGGTQQLFAVSCPRMGIAVKWVEEPDKIEEWEKLITPKTKLLHVESPTQGAAITRTSPPSSAGNRASRSFAPAISQARPSHTRTVIAGAVGNRPSAHSFTTSKWW